MTIDSSSPEFARVLAENAAYAAQFDRSALPAPPARRLAVLTCMDARISVEAMMGLRTGDAHVIRNAGGLVTDDALRSLVISHHLLGTREVIVVAHTGCGMLGLRDEAVRRDLAARTGAGAALDLGGFDDLEVSLRRQVQRVREHPWTRELTVHGLIYETVTGRLREPS